MPQIAQILETYASQFFWLLIVFGLIYFTIGHGMLPKIEANMDARDRKIADDLAAAEHARAEANNLGDSGAADLTAARTAAQAKSAAAKAKATKDADARLAKADAEISAKIAAADAELAIYRQHENNPQDSRYRAFLNKLAAPLSQRLGTTGLTGLDFGCGPGPLLAKMLSEAGHKMALWDPFFANQPEVLQRQYDFISCSEAIEHFVNPCQEWALWLKLLKPGGTLAIMTKRYTTAAAFASWHYKNDPTHISFFATATFRYLAQRDGFDLSVADNDVVILQRKH